MQKLVANALRPSGRMGANLLKTTSFYRYQSSAPNPNRASNKKKISVIEQQKQKQVEAEKAVNSAEVHDQRKVAPQSKQKIRKGFSSLAKVPSTDALNPEDVLLDTFFQGYKPLTIPLRPPTKKRQTILYLDMDEGFQMLGNALEDLASATKESPALKDYNKARFQFSNTSFSDNDSTNERRPNLRARLPELSNRKTRGRMRVNRSLYKKKK
ncbi:hypothetical protein HPODL_00660 [Ogataea parapolymorpha DL-1]|uniref:Uncharacterized protein n=1 Tax=Ogataea parapolymorpha (strain ATCC 26012 / BCRC 20466 / JCM 22074 / NRRL Y-7560 / DL-1) TaxID=871575 RepID=W1QGQ5_OGAPD|nr:hypothetical protein HPODL_00660 [Ogataea parapolymorpha DL-1]ESX01263.1 hypothetical protein HPODL_00660 [Ogataea parapolymorpha DL-1]